YALDAGAVREDYATRSNAYGDFVMSGTFRRGITDHFTTEFHAEGQSGGVLAAGVDAAVQAGDFGVATLTGALGGDGNLGWLGGVGCERSGERISLFAQSRYASEDFEQLGTTDRIDRPKLRTFGGFGFNLERYGSLQLSYGRQTYWTRSSANVYGLNHSVTLGNFGYLSFIA